MLPLGVVGVAVVVPVLAGRSLVEEEGEAGETGDAEGVGGAGAGVSGAGVTGAGVTGAGVTGAGVTGGSVVAGGGILFSMYIPPSPDAPL